MSRLGKSDLEWQCIQSVVPDKSRGVKRVDDRGFIAAIVPALCVGWPLAELAVAYAPARRCTTGLPDGQRHSVRDTIMEADAEAHNVDGVMVDDTRPGSAPLRRDAQKGRPTLDGPLTGRIDRIKSMLWSMQSACRSIVG